MIQAMSHYPDAGIQNLLDLHGSILDQGDGYWIKLQAWPVNPTDDIPHGVRYSLTLHEPYGKRILGYDNAHAVKPPKKFKFVCQPVALRLLRGSRSDLG